jgi:hypothetical protein
MGCYIWVVVIHYILIAARRLAVLGEYCRFYPQSPRVRPRTRPSVFSAPAHKENPVDLPALGDFRSPEISNPPPEQLRPRPESWAQIDFVAVFIHEGLLGAVVVGRRARMYRKISIGIGAGSGDLRENRLLTHKIPAHAHNRLRERRDYIGTELLVGDQIKGTP